MYIAHASQAGGYFETVIASPPKTTLRSPPSTQANAQRASGIKADGHRPTPSYLRLELEMQLAEMAALRPGRCLERVAQLINKTNQFNLTTRRYTLAEMDAAAASENNIALYGRLADKFGDNGLVSVVLGERRDTELHMVLWLMSCRVLKRDMELAMLDAVVSAAAAKGIRRIMGYYLPTKKNGMVAGFYDALGFTQQGPTGDGGMMYSLDIDGYRPRNRHIQVATDTETSPA